MINNNNFICKIKRSSMLDHDKFAIRLYKITAWLNKRYNLKSKDVDFDYYLESDDKKNNLVTIKLSFR